MNKTDNVDDMIDAAFDAAEADLLDKAEDREEVAEPSSNEPEEAPIQTATEELPKEEVAEKEEKSLEANDKEQQAEAVNAPTAEVQPTGEEPKLYADPEFYSSQEKKLLAKAPREVQELVALKEAQRNKFVNKIVSESEQGRAIGRRFNETFGPFAGEFEEQGIKDPFAAMDSMLKWDKAFRSDPKGAIVELMKRNGLTPNDLIGQHNQQGDYETDYSDPRVEQALQEAQEAKRAAEEFRRHLEEQKSRELSSEIQSFRKGTDSQGNVREKFAALHASQISQLSTAIQAQNPGISLVDALDQAYETILSQARAVFGNSVTARQPNVGNAKKARAAAGSIAGAPQAGVGPGRKKARTIDEALELAEEELGLR